MGKVLTTLAFLCALIFCPPATEASLRTGTFRLGLDSTLFRFSYIEYQKAGESDNDFYDTSLGLGVSNPGLNIGTTILDGLVLGGRISVGRIGQDQFLNSGQYINWSALPYFEYVFSEGVLRPYIALQFGAEGVAKYPNDDTSWWSFDIQAGGGLHFFAYQYISIDLGLLAGFAVGTGVVSDTVNSTEFRHWRFTASCLLGVSGWL
jgi:hypothetical protein